jgi:hypothetical protein
MSDRTAAALTDATDVIKTVEFFATHTDTPLTPTERLQAISLLIGDWKSDRAVLDRPPQTFAEHTAEVLALIHEGGLDLDERGETK